MLLATASAAACASATGGGGTRTAAGTGAPALPAVSVSQTLRGTFTNMLQSTGGVGPANQIRVDGSVTVLSTGVGNTQTRVQLTINLPAQNESLPWAIAPGPCGNGAIAVTDVNKFGTIEVGSAGRGTLDVDLAVALAPGAQYHLEVYRSGQTLHDVMACANLRKVE